MALKRSGKEGNQAPGVTRRTFFWSAGRAAGVSGVLGGALLAACAAPGGAGDAAPKASRSGKVLFWMESSNEVALQTWDAISASFKEAYPNIELTFDRSPVPQGQSRDDKLFAALSAGAAWDVWQRDIPPSYQQPLVDRKAVLALDEYYATMPNLKRVLPWARARSKLFGKTWGVPHEVEFIPIFYNKNVFQKAGIKEHPKTWEQFLKLNQTLKASGVQPMNIAKGRTNPGHNYSIYLMGVIGKDGFEDLLYRDKRWDQNEGVIRAAQTLLDFVKQGWIPADNQTGSYDLNNDFQNATLAMWGTGTWSVSGFEQRKRETPGFEYSFFVPPSENSKIKPTIAGGLGGGFSVWSETKDRQSTITFADFLMSPISQKHWIEIRFQVAPVPFKPEEYKVPEGMAGALKTIASGQEMGYNISVVVPAKFVDVYWDGLVDILKGTLTPKEWAGRLQREWETAKSEGRTPKP
ncbi:MAG: carbohydrate ABC transporter substrate-binding protein [Chloroflexi bacterium]|nr:carbohydrate ABC transporter substrate-binding protein [Chloroflexota bacterium]